MLNLDFSYINTQSVQYLRYDTWCKPALTGNPPYNFNATDAVIQSIVKERDGKTLDAQAYRTIAKKRIDAYMLATETAIGAGINPPVAKDSFLHIGSYIGDLAMTFAYCHARFTDDEIQSVIFHAEQALFNVWNATGEMWGTKLAPDTDWAANNPGNNYHYSFILATVLWGATKKALGIQQGTDWMQFLRDNKWPPLVAYYKANGSGGGSREGTGYGTAHSSLFGLYCMWRELTPEHQDLSLESSHVADTVDYWLHATLPNFKLIAPIGDWSRNPYPYIYDSHRALMLQSSRTLGEAHPKSAIATYWLNRSAIRKDGKDVYGRIGSGENLSIDLLPVGTTEAAPDKLYHYSLGAGHLFARTDWTDKATWMSLVAGIYDETHAHEDQGAFTIFKDDFIVVSPNPYSTGLRQTTEHHNTLRFEINGAIQPQQVASVTKKSKATMMLLPGENGKLVAVAGALESMYVAAAGVTKWARTISFEPNRIQIGDLYSTIATTVNRIDRPAATATFQMNTRLQPVMDGKTITFGATRLYIDAPANPVISFRDWSTIKDSAGKGYSLGWRISIGDPEREGKFSIRLETSPIGTTPPPSTETPTEEDPEMIKELQAQVAALTATNQTLTATVEQKDLAITTLSTKATTFEEQVSYLTRANASLSEDLATQDRIINEQQVEIEASAPQIAKLNLLTGALKIINEAA